MGKGVISDEEDEIEAEFDDREPIDGEELDDRGDDEEDEEDEEGQDEYEKDGFIVDDVEEEEEEDEDERAESDEERQKKKKKKKKEDYVLDEEDYALLEDNNITVHRRKASKKFKRLKKAQRDAAEEPSGLSDEEEFIGRGKSARSAEEKVERSLFDDDDGGPPFEEIAEEGELAEEEEEMLVEDDEDEMDGFIVDEFDDRGEPVKKKSGRKRYISSNSSEAIDMFGEYEQLLKRRKQVLRVNENREKTLEDEFDPSILSERYMTKRDEEIWNLDIPERIQMSEEITEPYTHQIIEEETLWIFSQLAYGPLFHKGMGTDKYKEDLRNHIARFLELYHMQKCDIPFIAMYRKDECFSLLEDPESLALYDEKNRNERPPTLKWHKVLWAVHELDKKWLLLQKRKSALKVYYHRRFEEETRTNDDVTKHNLNQQLFESIMMSLKAAESEKEVDDVDSKFNLHFPPGEVDDRQYKRPVRKSRYSICAKAGLWELANKFGYSSEQLGMQLSLVKMGGEELEDPKLTPEEMASNFTCAMFATPQKVLQEARDMAAIEISCEPGVRKFVRSYYMDHATVFTCPTTLGDTEIDSFHQFAGVKWLQNKPLHTFEDAQWLLIQKAEESKLLQVNIKMQQMDLDNLNNEFNIYLSDGVSRSAQLWNEQRKLILQVALSRILQSMEKEARSLLTSRAKNWLLMEYGKALWNKVSIGPYQKKETDLSSDDEGAPRVMACCWGGKNSQTTFVMLDASGELIDVLYTGSLTSKSQNADDQQRSKIEQDRVLKFMTDHQPHVVVLGAADLSCVKLKDNIYEIIFKMVEENPRDLGHEMDMLNIVYGDESLPCLYEHSQISLDQLPGHGSKGIVRRAVALGRYLQNPLAMVATLCGPRREILSWKLNRLENFLTPDEKYGMVEQVMVDVTNQVGLDINLALAHEWLFAPLQFISGLGPRKAAFLKKSLLRRGAIFIRKDLVAEHKLGRKVFLNAAGFLRVRRSGLAATSSQFIDLLDDTRIQPESYALAQELAKDVYDVDGSGDVNDNEALEAIENVRDRPSYLKSLDIYEYAQTKKYQSKRLTLYDIRRELIQGFQDWRRPYEAPNPDEEFYMLSHETEETLSEGRVVQARVVRVQDRKAILELDSGLTGFLAKEDYTDDWRDITDLSDRLSEGDVLTCKIKSIQKNRHHVFLVCKQSEMRNNRTFDTSKFDPYYLEDRSRLQSEQDKARKEKELAKRHFKPRMIVHPRFQNVTADEAMEFLSDKDPGESIIRPSSRGPSYLTLTLKVYDGVYAHKDIAEGGKEHRDITSLLRIGKTLKIGEDTFEDLDEVMDRYVDPLVSHLKAMLSYRKFRRGSKTEVDEQLKIEKSECPMRIVYCFGISHEHPGTFILTYIRSSNPHHEYIGLYPKGFKFRKRMFEDIDRLVSYFQRHIDDPVNDSAPSIRSVAAMVPMRSPATGGASGGSVGGSPWGSSMNGSGWRSHSYDRDRSSTPGSRTGRSDYRTNRDGHPSGLPRPHGGRGRGRGSYNSSNRGNSSNNERQDSGYVAPRWDSATKDGNDGWNSFPGAKVQNSPGREAFPGGWASSGNGAGDSGWVGGTGGDDTGPDNRNSGWGGDIKKSSQVDNGSGWSGNGNGGW